LFGGRALDRGSSPQWDGTGCSKVACHGNGLAAPPPVTPVWLDPKTGACGTCHGLPPTSIHTPNTNCDRVECHGAEITRDSLNQPIISQAGKALHIDGIIEHK
ncbi:MAG TPA: CxxxxCH/CxxCH domain-containing protein, partial [Polyangiaceae bacterium]